MPRRLNSIGLPAGPDPNRIGRNQLLARRMMIAAGSTAVSGAAIMEVIYPDRDWPEWRWQDMRQAAERFGERVLEPRNRPLMWRLKPGALDRKE